jgi:hypothetical protein
MALKISSAPASHPTLSPYGLIARGCIAACGPVGLRFPG